MKRLVFGILLAASLALLVFQFLSDRNRIDDANGVDSDDRPAESTRILLHDEDRLKFIGDETPAPSPDDFADSFDCNLEELVDNPQSVDDLFGEQLAPLIDTLMMSGNTEHLLSAAFLSRIKDPFSVLSNTQQALQLNPRHPLVLWSAADLCQREQGGEFCGSTTYQKNVDAVLGKNGAYWARLAAYRHNRGDRDGALKALKHASVEPEFDFLWIDHIVMLERGLAVTGDMSYSERVMAAIGIAAALPEEGMRLSKICFTEAEQDAVWMRTCADYAKRLSDDGRTALNQVFGYEMQALLHEMNGNDGAMRQARASGQELRDVLLDSSDASLLLMVDDGFAARFVDEYVTGGEIAAFEFAIREAERLTANPDYDPCSLAALQYRDR